MVDRALADWLLDSDPALRWQVERDLLGAPEAVWAATRARVATEGFGARMLALQDPDGQWAGGAFFPGGFDFGGPEAAEGAGQGRVWFEVDVPAGERSKWLTLSGTRVLEWWDASWPPAASW